MLDDRAFIVWLGSEHGIHERLTNCTARDLASWSSYSFLYKIGDAQHRLTINNIDVHFDNSVVLVNCLVL